MADSEPESPLDSPASPDDSPFANPLDNGKPKPASGPGMTQSSSPLGPVNAARNPLGAGAPQRGTATPMNADMIAKMKAFGISRGMPPQRSASQTPVVTGPVTGGISRPGAPSMTSSPVVRPPGGMKRPGAPGGLPGQTPSQGGAVPARVRPRPGFTLGDIGGGAPKNEEERTKDQNGFSMFAKNLDTKEGKLKFPGKAVISGDGVVFENGRTFSISLDQLDTMDELGKGNYGTVFKARHARPRVRKPGQGLAGNAVRGPQAAGGAPEEVKESAVVPGTSGQVMAIKEIRLELDELKFGQIIMELDILHRCISPYIVDFYGAFFQEGAVYICMEWMDGGSVDKIYGDGVPENVLRKITLATVQGLKCLKEEHNIIHRDVKPTNILMNTRGHVKICDFGVSGNLVASIAKTNIGCQSYMAPERIKPGQAGAMAGPSTYSAQSDIWSLGLTIIESAMGRYPYPPETYDNIFSQLAAIVDGEPPDLPADRYSLEARDFVAGCLHKIPKLRPTYPALLQHPWLAQLVKPAAITEEDEEAAELAHAAGENIAQTGITADADFYDKEVGEWVIAALEKKKAGKLSKSAKPALHAVALDAVSPQEKPVVVEA